MLSGQQKLDGQNIIEPDPELEEVSTNVHESPQDKLDDDIKDDPDSEETGDDGVIPVTSDAADGNEGDPNAADDKEGNRKERHKKHGEELEAISTINPGESKQPKVKEADVDKGENRKEQSGLENNKPDANPREKSDLNTTANIGNGLKNAENGQLNKTEEMAREKRKLDDQNKNKSDPKSEEAPTDVSESHQDILDDDLDSEGTGDNRYKPEESCNTEGSCSKTREVLSNVNAVDYTAPTLRESEDRAIEQRNHSQIRGLTNNQRTDKIETKGYIQDNFNRNFQRSTIGENLKAVNPNWKKLDGYDNNCQRCVPTYVLRRRGYDVEALPAGENKEIDNLIKYNPHIIWKKTGSPVIPKSTRGSLYFGKPEIEKFMKDLPDGAMCEIYCEWKDKDYAHVFIAEKHNKKVLYIDPQTGNTDVSHYFNKMVEDSTTYWRIDNADIDENLIKYCCKNKE